MPPVADPAALALLEGIEKFSASLTGGAEPQLLQYRWRKEGRADADLARAMGLLVQDQWIEVLPGNDPALRLTVSGYQRLCARPVIEAPPEPEAADAAAPAPARSVSSECSLREQVLAIYALLRVPAGGAIAAGTMSRIWAQAGAPAEELRHAVDVLDRDGHLSVQRGAGGAKFTLTAEGLRFLSARATPAALLRAAPAAEDARRRGPKLGDELVLALAVGRLLAMQAQAVGAFGFGAFAESWKALGLTAHEAARAADLLHRFQCAEVQRPEPLVFSLTGGGQQFVAASGGSDTQNNAQAQLAQALGKA